MGGGNMDWKYRSGDCRSVSLHDHTLTECLSDDGELLLIFEHGFDVCAENPLNDTGRHKHTGKAAVALENGRFLEGTLYVSQTEEKQLYEEEIAELTIDVIDFKRYPDSVFLACDAWIADHDVCYCQIEFACAGVEFCWNEFTDDAWFQD